ncbi:hypothetical protein, partial [Chitinophaga sp.]|uniref:hypothetical protein n=1 Tax=Chitinophaga sp. TaxID=1869181 RepID=UPI002F9531E3
MKLLGVVFILFVLAGCSAGPRSAMMPDPPMVALAQDVPLYPVLGGFKLNKETPTIDALLEAFSRNGAKAFKDRGLKYNYVEVYPGRAWCDISFKSGLLTYMFGVQFVQAPDGGVIAVVRNMRTVEGYPVDNKVLDINTDVYAALLEA